MRNEAGRRWYHSIGLALICTRGNFKTKINIPNFQNSAVHWYFYVPLRPEPIFVNVLGVPELIPDSQCGSPNATKESPGHVLLSNNCMYSIFLWSFLFLTVPHRLVSTSPLTFPLHFGSGPTIRLKVLSSEIDPAEIRLIR
jgi:hypothetical protein